MTKNLARPFAAAMSAALACGALVATAPAATAATDPDPFTIPTCSQVFSGAIPATIKASDLHKRNRSQIDGTNGPDVVVIDVPGLVTSVNTLDGDDLICISVDASFQVNGGAGNDVIEWEIPNMVQGSTGGDRDPNYVKGMAQSGTHDFFGGTGDDVLLGDFAPQQNFDGGPGNDYIYGGGGVSIYWSTGRKNNQVDHTTETYFGGDGDDVIVVSRQDSIATVDGGAGHDNLYGGGWATTGCQGYDRAGVSFFYVWSGGPCRSTTDLGVGVDTISGGDGDDVLEGFGGADTLLGGDGTDTINAAGVKSGVDTVDGGFGFDTVTIDATDVWSDAGDGLSLTIL